MTARRSPLFLASALALALAGAVHAQQAAAPPPIRLTVRTDRPDALYRLGETATFLVQVRYQGVRVREGTVSAQLSDDGYRPLGTAREVPIDSRGFAEVRETLAEPGFLRCAFTYRRDGASATALGGAGYEPERIRPAARMPADFDAFWKAGKQELARVPVDAKLTQAERYSDADVEAYKINLANIGGTRVYGWISVPRKAGPFPAVLVVPGAGVYPQGPAAGFAKQGALSMNISVHDMDVDLPAAAYTAASEGPLRAYPHQGKADREKFYYRRVILGCVRAIDYLTSRPDWNRKHVAVVGGSQGGALSFITGGVDPRVTAIAPNVAAMCDHTGFTLNRVSGWPQLAANVPEEERAAVARASAYYDAVNFARRFRGPALAGVGFIDTTCPPTTVYAAYNSLRGPREMITSPLMGHSTDPRFTARQARFLAEHFAGEPR